MLRQCQILLNHYHLLICVHVTDEVRSYARETTEYKVEKIMKREEMKTEGKDKEGRKVKCKLKRED